MIVLFLGILIMLVVLGLSFIWPRKSSEVQSKAVLLSWYKTRKQEINSDLLVSVESKDQLLAELDERVMEDIDNDQQKLSFAQQQVANKNFPWVKPLLIIVLFFAATGLYWVLGASKDVYIAEELFGDDGTIADAAAMSGVIGQIESRLSQTPDNAYYWLLLARYYTERGRHLDSLKAYDELLRLEPNDASFFALAAQSEYLLENRKLTERVFVRARRALELDPIEITALGLLGIGAFEQNQFQQAIDYWERLLNAGVYESAARDVIRQGIFRARAQLGSKNNAAIDSQLLPAVIVQVSLAESGLVNPQDTVFILARVPGQKMPIAVQKHRVIDLPLEIRIDDRDSMLEGRKLSDQAVVEVVAQISPSGKPGRQYSTLEALGGPVKAEIQAPILSLVLRPFK